MPGRRGRKRRRGGGVGNGASSAASEFLVVDLSVRFGEEGDSGSDGAAVRENGGIVVCQSLMENGEFGVFGEKRNCNGLAGGQTETAGSVELIPKLEETSRVAAAEDAHSKEMDYDSASGAFEATTAEESMGGSAVHCNVNGGMYSNDVEMGRQLKDSGYPEGRGCEQLNEESQCDFDMQSSWNMKKEDSIGTPNEEQQGSKKSRRLSGKGKSYSDMPLRRSARRAASAALQSPGDDASTPVKAPSSGIDEVPHEGKPELPPSSKIPNLDGLHALDVFSVYSCLRSFSTVLFLSPCSLGAFVEALRCSFANSLIDSVHFTILQALKIHLERLSEEGTRSASDCLSGANWGLLDSVTWPVFLVEYLLFRSSAMKPCYKLVSLNLLEGEYYKQPAAVKLEILRCLCDDVIEVELVRSELRRRMLGVEPDVEGDQDMIHQNQKKGSSMEDLQSPFPVDADGQAVDVNSDDCCLCKMEGTLICCDGCPAAFHSRCVGVVKDALPEGDWFCPECAVGKLNWPVKQDKPFSGAELLGVDNDGRLYFGSCSYLLVSDPSDCGTDACYYYCKSDISAVIDSLMKHSQVHYSEIISAISVYWSIYGDSSKACEITNCALSSPFLSPLNHRKSSKSKKESANPPPPKKFSCQRLSISESSKMNTVIEEDSLGKNGQLTCFKSSVSNVPSTLVRVSRRITADCSTRSANPSAEDPSLKNSEASVECISLDQDPAGSVTDQGKCWAVQIQCEPNVYVNHYSFGQVASSIAAELLSKSSESNNIKPYASINDIMSTQLKVISKTIAKFGRSVVQKLSLYTQKESCGWCLACKMDGDQKCLLIIAENKFLEASKSLSAGFRSVKNRKNHIVSAVHHMLSIEDNMHGLLSGPWENPLYRKNWRKDVLKTTDVTLLKKLLLILESNIRRVALSADWLKPVSVDSDLSIGSACHVFPVPINASSKQLSGRKRGRKSKSELKKNISDAEICSLSNVAVAFGIYWWRGGKLSRQLFQWKRLPRSLTTKSSRQAGCQKIPGILYPDGSYVAKRSKCLCWRAAVEMSKTVAELMCHVKDLDSNIRWSDLKNTHVFSNPAKEFQKLRKPLKNVMIRRKCVEDKKVNYVVDFGRKKAVPEGIIKQAVMHEETASGRKKYWLNEYNIPLGLLKAFEVKKLEQMANNNKMDKNEDRNKLLKRKRVEGFSYLFSKHERLDHHKCGQCSKDVSAREAVGCQSCGGFFHKKHFRVPNGVIAATYRCSWCKDMATALSKKRDRATAKTRKKKAATKIDSVGNKREKRKSFSVGAEAVKLKTKKRKIQVETLKRGTVKSKRATTELRRSSRIKKSIVFKIRKQVRRSKKGKKTKSLQKFTKATRIISFHRRRRTIAHYSYWLNGLLWGTKPNDERGISFRSTRVLMPSMHSNNQLMNPVCILCREEYNSELIYLGCEKCGDWFHGLAFAVTLENVNSLSGFRCHKCRLKRIPLCPYLGSGSVAKAHLLEESNVEAGSSDSLYLHDYSIPQTEEHVEQLSKTSEHYLASVDSVDQVWTGKATQDPSQCLFLGNLNNGRIENKTANSGGDTYIVHSHDNNKSECNEFIVQGLVDSDREICMGYPVDMKQIDDIILVQHNSPVLDNCEENGSENPDEASENPNFFESSKSFETYDRESEMQVDASLSVEAVSPVLNSLPAVI